MSEDKTTHWELDNGLQVICLPLAYVEYVAVDLLCPGGVIHDREGQLGASLLLGELLSRGAGTFSSEQLLSEFDDRGIRHGESASLLTTTLRSQFLPDHCTKALELMKLMVMSPAIPESAIEPVKALFLHDIRSLKESPSRWAMLELSLRYFPTPYNKNPLGCEADIISLTAEELRHEWQQRFGPRGAVLSIAGKIDIHEVERTVAEQFSGWQGECPPLPEISQFPDRELLFLPFEGSQQQLVLRYPAPSLSSDLYYAGKVFTQILSGGMFGRLFIEVRENRGLCYSVYAQHSGRPEYGHLTVYAGTTPERVHETYTVINEIMADPLKGLSEEELTRAKNNLLTQMILGEESTSSRARSNASDWLLLKHIRSMKELQEGIQGVDVAQLNRLLSEYPLQSPMGLTLGAKNFGGWKEIKEGSSHDG
ncbi:MAG: M16 family metallopeptidase [Bdellovibrionota bacterium]